MTPLRYRHRARGTTYRLLGAAVLQTQPATPLVDDDRICLVTVAPGLYVARPYARLRSRRYTATLQTAVPISDGAIEPLPPDPTV